MPELWLLMAGPIAAARLATPVMTRKHHRNARHVAKDANTSATFAGR